MNTRLGKFIVLEGTDGSGTTSQAERLRVSLTARGILCLQTREPSRGPVGQLLRAALERRLTSDDGLVDLDWATLSLLFAADRMDHVRSEIEPALASGTWVVSDRYTLSSFIYQSITAPEPSAALTWVTELNLHALRPDLVIVLDVSKEIAEERRNLRGGPEELFDRRELQAKLAEAYQRSERYCSDPVVHVDGAASLDAVAGQVLFEVSRRFSLAKMG